MKSLKRLITVILALSMILTSVGIVGLAASSFSDISDSKVATAVDKLVAYGIITGYDDNGDGVAESFKPDNQITRAEFAAIVTRMKGVADNLPKDSVTGFWDLDSDSSRAWARPYVKAAVDLKIINGFEDGSFRAAEPVTYEQAVKMLICAIGYDVIAQSEYNKAIAINPNATWSAGYIAAANKHGITKNVMTSQITLPANRGVVAVLTSNSVDAPALEQDENGNLTKPEDGAGQTEGNMVTITGVITDTFYTGLDTDDTNLEENEIRIDSTKDENDGKYTLSDSLRETIDLDKYIGRKVSAYYDNLEGEITSIRLENVTSKIIKEEHIVSADATQIKTKDENNKSATENIAGATFIVNGKYVDNYDFENNFKNGTVEIFTALGKKIVVVNSYDVFVVNSFDRNNEKVFIKYATYDHDKNPVTEKVNFYQFPSRASDKPKIYVASSGSSNYKLTSFDSLSLSQYDVINYLESPAGTAGDPVRKMYVTKGSKSGKVTSGLGEGRKVELNDKIMYLTQQYNAFTGNSNEKKAPFILSDNYTYYVDYLGQIAAVNYNENSSGSSWSYGYIVYGDSRAKEIGILKANGEVEYYTLNGKVKIDGEKKDPSNVFDILKDSALVIDANANANTLSETDGYAQPIKYSTSGTAIEGLDTVLGADGELSSSENTLERGDDFTYDGKLGSSKGSTSTSKVTAKSTANEETVSYAVNSSTFVLFVPKDRGDEDAYAKMSNTTAFAVSEGELGKRYVEVFGVDSTSSNKLAKMVIVYDVNPTLNFIGSSPYLIVTEKGGAGDNELLRGYVNGDQSNDNGVVISENSFVVEGIGSNANPVTYDNVGTGDIVRFIKDAKGEAVAIERIYKQGESGLSYTTKNDEAYISKTEGSGSDFVAIMGTIINKDTTDSKLTVETGTSKERIHKFNNNTKVFKLSSAGEVELSSMDEVYDGTGGMAASTVILITTSLSAEATAQTIYVIEQPSENN